MQQSGITHHTFTNQGCNIHYWQRPGNGTKHVLFFHGAGLDHNMFEPQMKIFAPSYTLTFWDARGHGLSKLHDGKRFAFDDMVSDCKMIYEILGIERAIIIGQSMGGNLAQTISYRHPQMVEKMILIGCTRNTGKLTAIEKLMLRLTKPTLRCYPWRMLVKQSAAVCSNRADVRQYVEDCFRKMGKAAFIETFASLTECLHEDTKFRFAHPVLLLCGADDKSGNIKKIAQSWVATDSNCTAHIIDRAAHNANQDNPDAVNEHIGGFV